MRRAECQSRMDLDTHGQQQLGMESLVQGPSHTHTHRRRRRSFCFSFSFCYLTIGGRCCNSSTGKRLQRDNREREPW